MMKFNCKKIACLVGGIVILGAAGLSAGCHAQEPQVQVPVQGVCESPFGPASPLFEDVKQIYLLWDYNAGKSELLAGPLREDALKKEVLDYMQTYLTPCSKSKVIMMMDRHDGSIMRNKNNLIAYVVSTQYSDFRKDEKGKYQSYFSNGLTIRAGFYRPGLYMTAFDLLLVIREMVKLDGDSDDVEGRISSIIRSRLGIRGRPHDVIE